jgi:hypothetical protein
LSNAERQRAYRERELKRRAEAAVAEVEELEALDASVLPEPVAKPSPRSLPLSEEAYVELMLSEPHILDRKRAERYARWRYRGVVKGEVAGL